MDSHSIAHQQIGNVSFGVYTAQDIKKLAVLEINNVQTFDSLGHPTPRGLCDNALGEIATRLVYHLVVS